jgi:lactate permease
MNDTLFFLSWSPVILLAALAMFFRQSAFRLSVYGVLFSAALVVLAFGTPPDVAAMACVDGVLTTIPLLLVIFFGILLSNLLLSSGSLKRLVEWLESVTGNAFHRNLLISLGVCNFMEGAAVIAEPVVAPMLHAAGVSATGAAALSVIGYSGLMTLEMAGIIITVLSLVTEIPMGELAVASAWLSIPATLAMAGCVPLFLPETMRSARHFFWSTGCGLVLGIVALGAVIFVGVSISGILAGLGLILIFLLISPNPVRVDKTLLFDLAPFFLMLAALMIVNTVPAIRTLTFEKLAFHVKVIPVHTISFRPLFSAYPYLMMAFVLSACLLKIPAKQVKTIIATGLGKGWRTFSAMALFGAMGQVLAFSGYSRGFEQLDPAAHIPWILSQGLQRYTGSVYPIFVPLLGWAGTFLTGYGVASLMLFGRLQVETAGVLGVSATWLSAGLAVGASLGSVSSPFKIALATVMCGAMGKEGAILRWTIPLGISASFLVGVILYVTAGFQ